MGSACIKITKYFLFLFSLLFLILGGVILGFGVWILADKSSFIFVLQSSSSVFNVGAYVFISVGAVTMFMGLLGCVGAVKEVRCLLGLYFVFLLLVLIAQVTAGVLFYFNMGKVKQEMGSIVIKLIRDYKDGEKDRLQQGWDYVQAQGKCCGWASPYNWTENAELMNRTTVTYPCSCEVKDDNNSSSYLTSNGFCEHPSSNMTQSGNNPCPSPHLRALPGGAWRLPGSLPQACLPTHCQGPLPILCSVLAGNEGPSGAWAPLPAFPPLALSPAVLWLLRSLPTGVLRAARRKHPRSISAQVGWVSTCLWGCIYCMGESVLKIGGGCR
ncbi:CD82 molecule [Phyllostomus discolor]|uniref:CD82 molecule n=1 Tax=Phyllostomus discolor TaxID=89673 RepID=A0A834A496_9CHIR|nr:CD82 molecule [Phyllostomus discolor]